MTKKTNLNFSELSQELDSILEALQSGGLDIDEAVKQYERGMSIIKEQEKYLKNAENQIITIKSTFEKS